MKPAPQKYRTTNWKAYNEALKARGSSLIWLDPKMSWHGQASGKRGRIQTMPTTTGLHLLVDSTGIKMLGEGEWKTRKHGAYYRRQWRKVHLGIDAGTLEIRAMEVTDNSIGGAPVLPGLLSQIPADAPIASQRRRRRRHDGVPRGHRSACGARSHPHPQERQALENEPLRCRCTQCNPADHAQVGSGDLEEMERLPPAQPG